MADKCAYSGLQRSCDLDAAKLVSHFNHHDVWQIYLYPIGGYKPTNMTWDIMRYYVDTMAMFGNVDCNSIEPLCSPMEI